MPSKRVSLKGKGADLFFGDYKPAQAASPSSIDSEARPSPINAPIDESAEQAAVPAEGDSPRIPPAVILRSAGRPANDRPQIDGNPDSTSVNTITSKRARQLASTHASVLASELSDNRAINENPDSSSIDIATSKKSREHASTPASTLASELADNQADAVQAIRKIVRVSGKDVSYVRLTPEEKAQVADIIYTYKRQGQKTSETEIYRIALNFLLNDYHENGSDSVLVRVLAALQA